MVRIFNPLTNPLKWLDLQTVSAVSQNFNIIALAMSSLVKLKVDLKGPVHIKNPKKALEIGAF